MVAVFLVQALVSGEVAPSGPTNPAAPIAAMAESASAAPRIVRTFPPTEVRALLHDMSSSETVRLIPGSVLRLFPVDGLAGILALQAGVVAQGEELHVRGGRHGETAVSLDGIGLNEPLRRRAMEVPLLALRSAELVTGAPEAQYGGGLAGMLSLHTVDPGERPSAEWRWQSDAGLDTHYDRAGVRVGTPLHVLGLGAVAAWDGMFDDTWQPALRTRSRHQVAGLPLGWRAENRNLGYLKLAPVRNPERFHAQVIAGRQNHQPYSPDWALDGWVLVPPNLKESPVFSPVPLPGYQRYRAADHLAITDDRQIATLIETSMLGPARRISLGLGWLRTRTVTSVGGGHEPEDVSHRPRYENIWGYDRFHVPWGDWPLYRESGSDVFTLRGECGLASRTGGSLTTGAGLTYEEVSLREMDWMPFPPRVADERLPVPLDSVRSYRATAPGAFAYIQGRWLAGGLVMNTGLRAEYFTAGPGATKQTLPGSDRGVWSLVPRFGIAYPISVRDVFSFAYVRASQPPGRDFLYDQRTAITNRQPLGNPALRPATLISYQAALKHLFSPAWALQGALFYRDVFNQVGARDAEIPDGTMNLRYADDDQSSALGLEMSLVHAGGGRRRIEAHYVWMSVTGNESRPEGDPYGPIRSPSTPPNGGQSLSWDRRHSFLVSGAWEWTNRLLLTGYSALGSPLPWTPKQLRESPTDFTLVNSRRLGWTENTNVNLQWSPPRALGLTFGIEARNIFDNRAERAATLDGYPNPVINTRYDDYGAYRTETGLGGGAYWSQVPGEPGHWVPVHDPRLYNPPRALRASIGASW